MAHKKLLILITSLSVSVLTLSAYVEPYCATPPHLTPRSQGEHIERLNAGLSTYLTKAATESNYGCVSITPAVSISYDPTALAATLFGDFYKQIAHSSLPAPVPILLLMAQLIFGQNGCIYPTPIAAPCILVLAYKILPPTLIFIMAWTPLQKVFLPVSI